jgi:hypothetical protein
MRVSNGPASRIQVLALSGEHLFWADDEQGRDLLRTGKAQLIRCRGRARILQAVVSLRRDGELRMLGRGTALDRTRYSHNRETEDNPEKVWTLKYLSPSLRPVFMRVVSECAA